MTKDELWEQFLVRYPQFKDEEAIVKQTARGLRRFMEQAWDEGWSTARDIQKPDAGNPFTDMFGKFQK